MVAVNPSDVTVQITLPLVAWLFKSRIESRMRDELARILARDRDSVYGLYFLPQQREFDG